MAACPVAVLVGALLLTAGCGLLKGDEGLFADPRDEYVNATEGRPLKVPEGMQASVGDTWPIPEVVEQPTAKTYVGEVPRPRFLAGANVDAIKNPETRQQVLDRPSPTRRNRSGRWSSN